MDFTVYKFFANLNQSKADIFRERLALFTLHTKGLIVHLIFAKVRDIVFPFFTISTTRQFKDILLGINIIDHIEFDQENVDPTAIRFNIILTWRESLNHLMKFLENGFNYYHKDINMSSSKDCHI